MANAFLEQGQLESFGGSGLTVDENTQFNYLETVTKSKKSKCKNKEKSSSDSPNDSENPVSKRPRNWHDSFDQRRNPSIVKMGTKKELPVIDEDTPNREDSLRKSGPRSLS